MMHSQDGSLINTKHQNDNRSIRRNAIKIQEKFPTYGSFVVYEKRAKRIPMVRVAVTVIEMNVSTGKM